MSAQKTTTAIFIDKYHPKANGLCSVSIRVTFNRKKKYYPTPISLTIEDFEKIQSPKPRNGFKEIALKLQSYEKRAADILNELQVFTWLAFEKKYLSNKAFSNSINEAFSVFAESLRQNEQIGTSPACTATATTASSIPSAPNRLPRDAVVGCESPFKLRMNSTPAAMYAAAKREGVTCGTSAACAASRGNHRQC